MSKSTLASLAGASLLLLSVPAVDAGVIVDNLPAGGSSLTLDTSIQAPGRAAIGFTTPNQNLVLDKITLAITEVNANFLSAGLFTNDANFLGGGFSGPGSLVGSLNASLPEFTPVGTINLDPMTTYWIAVEQGLGGAYRYDIGSMANTGSGTILPHFATDTGGQPFTIILNGSPGIRVEASAPNSVVVPEPSSLAIFGFGSIGTVVLRRRKRSLTF